MRRSLARVAMNDLEQRGAANRPSAFKCGLSVVEHDLFRVFDFAHLLAFEAKNFHGEGSRTEFGFATQAAWGDALDTDGSGAQPADLTKLDVNRDLIN